VGENGVGKSTLLEGIAQSFGIDIRGGHGKRRYNNAPPPQSLAQSLHLTRGVEGRNTAGFFLRAETALGVFEYMSDRSVAGYGDVQTRELSHGEGFLQVLKAQATPHALYLLDEPEAALSFASCISLMAILSDVVRLGGQVICATHSPILSAFPGASILEVTKQGIVVREWDELNFVLDWRAFLANPHQYLQHVTPV